LTDFTQFLSHYALALIELGVRHRRTHNLILLLLRLSLITYCYISKNGLSIWASNAKRTDIVLAIVVGRTIKKDAIVVRRRGKIGRGSWLEYRRLRTYHGRMMLMNLIIVTVTFGKLQLLIVVLINAF